MAFELAFVQEHMIVTLIYRYAWVGEMIKVGEAQKAERLASRKRQSLHDLEEEGLSSHRHHRSNLESSRAT